ncbi:MAG: hypothetical protein ACXWCG_03505, partial [Flavitalea sp.]
MLLKNIPNQVVIFLLLSISILLGFRYSNIDERESIAAEMEKSLTTELLNSWYPRSVDSIRGGFLSS